MHTFRNHALPDLPGRAEAEVEAAPRRGHVWRLPLHGLGLKGRLRLAQPEPLQRPCQGGGGLPPGQPVQSSLLDGLDHGDPVHLPGNNVTHFWINEIANCFFQWMAGLITFLFPGLASHLRASYLPIHVFFGLLIFICACATALLGITEKAIFAFK